MEFSRQEYWSGCPFSPPGNLPPPQGSNPGGTVVKNPSTSAGDTRDAGSIPGSGRSPEVGNGNPLQYSYLENPMDTAE